METISKRYVTIEEAKKYGFILADGYRTNDLNKKLEDLKDFAAFGKLIPVVSFNHYDGKTYFEHETVFFEYKGYLLMPTKPYNKKMFRFWLIDSFSISDYKNKSEEPNQIGKPTEKKLNAWLDYLLAEETEKKEIQSLRDNKEAAFVAKLEATGVPIRWSKDRKSGWIDFDDRIQYNFEILNNGYISEKTMIRKSGLDSFLSLINNK